MNGGRIFNAQQTDLTPSPRPVSVQGPALVVCPAPALSMMGAFPAGFQEIYRLAYEKALAAARPSFYERLLIATPN